MNPNDVASVWFLLLLDVASMEWEKGMAVWAEKNLFKLYTAC